MTDWPPSVRLIGFPERGMKGRRDDLACLPPFLFTALFCRPIFSFTQSSKIRWTGALQAALGRFLPMVRLTDQGRNHRSRHGDEFIRFLEPTRHSITFVCYKA